MTARSYLYVPGDQPGMLAKAAGRGADALIVDLEDAVAPAAKQAARQNVTRWLDSLGDQPVPAIWVRVNAAGQDGSPPEADLATAAHPVVTGIVQAKCANAEQLIQLSAALDEAEASAGISRGTLRVAALVESAAGLAAVRAIAAAPRVCRLHLGEADLVADLGMEPGPDEIELISIRTSLVVASAAAGLEPPAGPASTSLTDHAALRRGSQALRRLGFAGRSAIHPGQVAVINEVFSPTAEQERNARALLERYDQSVAAGSGVFTDDSGRMVDRAVIRQAASVLAGARPMSKEQKTEPEPVAAPEQGDGPLAGLRVLDLATIYAGPLIAQLLGDFGADVIKVEHPVRGDGLRGHGRQVDGIGLWWKIVARNKSTIAVNLGDPDGADILLRLAATADVIIESFRPGTMERWGLGYDQLSAANPGLVLVRVSGFGQNGPYASRPGFGTLIEAMSGFAAVTGEPDGPPTLPPFGLADGVAGISGAMATMMALYYRDARGGRGQVVDLAVLDPLITVLGPQPTVYGLLGEIPARTGNRSTNNAPRNTYLTSDGSWVAISSSATSIAERIMRVIGHPELIDEPWFATGAGRAEHSDLIDSLVGDWIGAHSREEVLGTFETAQAAVAPVYDVSTLVADPHIKARETLIDVPDSDFGHLLMQNVLARLSASPGRIRFTGRPIGADTDAILIRELGLSDSYLEGLRSRGVIR